MRMNTFRTAPTLIIGVGNRWRRDDGAGPAAAEALAALGLEEVRVLETGGEGADLLDLWQGAERVILIDAASGLPACTVHRFDARQQHLPADLFGVSSHAFGVAQAVELGRALDCLPPCLTVYALAGCDFAHGQGLSPEAATAALALVAEIVLELGA